MDALRKSCSNLVRTTPTHIFSNFNPVLAVLPGDDGGEPTVITDTDVLLQDLVDLEIKSAVQAAR